MQAEVLYPMLDSLPKSEQLKILEKLQSTIKVAPKKIKRPIISDAEAKSYLIKTLNLKK